MNRVKSVFVSLSRNLPMAFSSVVLIFLTLFLLGTALIITINAREMSENIIESLQMHVYLKTDVDEEQITQTKQEIEQLNGVSSVEISTKEEELNNVTEMFDEDGDLIQEYFSGDKNPLNDILNVKVSDDKVDMGELKIQIESLDTVESADYGEEYGADKLIDFMNKISIGAVLVSIIFAIATMFLIINTIKLTINSRRKEIEIMRLVGATKGYITFPFAFEGAFLGFVGGTISFLISFYGYQTIISNSSGWIATSVVPANHMIIPLLIGQILFGILIGLFGSIIAIRNYLKV